MKNVILSLMLLGGISSTTVAMADDLSLSGDVNAGSRYIYRGQELNSDPTLGVDGKLDNIFLDGLYVSGQINTLKTTPINSTTTRSDVGVGYHTDLGVQDFDIDFSVHRVWNPSIYASSKYYNPYPNYFQNNYDEARVHASYNVFEAITVYADVGQIVSTGFSHDTYADVGAETSALLPVKGLTVGALVSGEHYRDAAVTKYNNTQVYAKYNIWKGLDVEGAYSFGGKNVDSTNINNYSYVGLRYNF